MNLKISILLLLFGFTLASCEWKSDEDDPVLNQLGTGHGIVTYTGYTPLKNKPIDIHFYIPEGTSRKCPSCLSCREPPEMPMTIWQPG